ncbi:MAG TPA: hypothetical protein DCZ10_11565 [Pelotomaculum sp.]|nr:hypothetical protein [Pelotomaculum sp.]
MTLTTEQLKGDLERIPVTCPGLTGDVKKGDAILLTNGSIFMRVRIWWLISASNTFLERLAVLATG